jgi:hypothetical protein
MRRAAGRSLIAPSLHRTARADRLGLLSRQAPARVDRAQQRLRVGDRRLGRQRLGDHVFRFSPFVFELQQHGERFFSEIRHPGRLRNPGVPDQEKARHFTLQFGDDVARLLLADPRQRYQGLIIGGFDRACDRSHRQRKRARSRLRPDAGNGDQGLEKFALHGVGKSEKREVPAVSLKRETRIDLQGHALAGPIGDFPRDARGQHDFVADPARFDQHAGGAAFEHDPGDA